MIIRVLKDIWDVEVFYDDLRWSSDKTIYDLDTSSLEEIRVGINGTLQALNDWQEKNLEKIGISNQIKIRRFRKKLIEFQKQVTQEIQYRERSEHHHKRVENMWNPEPKDAASISPEYGLQDSLKATPFHKTINSIFNPIPRSWGD